MKAPVASASGEWAASPRAVSAIREVELGVKCWSLVSPQRQLTGRELSSLAGRMAESTDPAEAMMLREQIVRGFYGGKANG